MWSEKSTTPRPHQFPLALSILLLLLVIAVGVLCSYRSPLVQHGLDHGPIFQLPVLQQVNALEFPGRNKVGGHRGVRNDLDVAAGKASH